MAVYLSKKINYADFTIKRGLWVAQSIPNYFSYLAKKVDLNNLTIKRSFWVAQSIPNYFVYLSRRIWRIRKT